MFWLQARNWQGLAHWMAPISCRYHPVLFWSNVCKYQSLPCLVLADLVGFANLQFVLKACSTLVWQMLINSWFPLEGLPFTHLQTHTCACATADSTGYSLPQDSCVRLLTEETSFLTDALVFWKRWLSSLKLWHAPRWERIMLTRSRTETVQGCTMYKAGGGRSTNSVLLDSTFCARRVAEWVVSRSQDRVHENFWDMWKRAVQTAQELASNIFELNFCAP